MPRRPLVLGHRGASGQAPENTLEAFALARSQGADGIEYDVQLSRDGHPMVFHDDDLFRTTGTRGALRRHDRAALEVLDAGSWRGRPCRIPGLPATLAGGFGLHDLELKTPDAAIDDDFRQRLARAAVPPFLEALGTGAIDPRSAVTSFDLGLLSQVAARWSALPWGVLAEDVRDWDRIRSWSPPRPPSVLALRAPLLRRIAPQPDRPPWTSCRLWIWGLPDDDPRPWLPWRPEAILVDDPAWALALLQEG